ncbi:MAG: hypothetical protein Q9187_000548 [Circinaria calcarea]
MQLFALFRTSTLLLLSILRLTLALPTDRGVSLQNINSRQATTGASTANLPVGVIYEFPKDTWVENLAVRPSGEVLVTLLTSPDVYQVDPAGASAAIQVYRFPGHLGCLGIVEGAPDVFYVIAGNYSTQTFQSTPGSYDVFQIQMINFSATQKPVVNHIASFGNSQFFNGITLLDSSNLLIADSQAGAVWKLSISSGAKQIVIQDPTMAPNSAVAPIGINGLRVFNGNLYFTNSNQAIFVRIPLKADGTAAGPAVTLATSVPGDDFTSDPFGSFYVAQQNNKLVTLRSPTPGSAQVLAGDGSSTSDLLGPTSAQFGRRQSDQQSLYVTSTGGIEAYITRNFTQGGRVSRVNLSASYAS